MRITSAISLTLCLSATIGFTGCSAGGESGVSSPGGGTGGSGNTPPVADAGLAQSATVGQLITLNGSKSTDADGDLLTYQWSFVKKHDSSSATLSNPTSIKPTFTADVLGEYVLQLVVNDDRATSTPATVTVTVGTTNLRPVANAGQPQSVPAEVDGVMITLHGEESSDEKPDQLTYVWTFDKYPGSDQDPKPLPPPLTNPSTANPTFNAKPGNYTIALQVSDGTLLSTKSTVVIKADGAPTAVPGPCDPPSPPCQLFVEFKAPPPIINLDGSLSSDPNNDKLTYKWDITTTPDNSPIVPTNPTAAKSSFTATQKGTYIAQLTVDDKFRSDVKTMAITVDDLKAVVSPVSQKVLIAREVTLQGEANMDSYIWNLTSKPSGSSLTIPSPTTVNAITFTPDQLGSYTIQLKVKKGQFESGNTAEARIQVKTVVAKAVSPVSVCSTVTLSAEASNASSPLAWTLPDRTTPSGSSVSFFASNTTAPGGGLVATVKNGTGTPEGEDSVTIDVDDEDRDPNVDKRRGTVGHRIYHYGPDDQDNGNGQLCAGNNCPLDCEECHQAGTHDTSSANGAPDLPTKLLNLTLDQKLTKITDKLTSSHTGGLTSKSKELDCRVKQLVNFLGNLDSVPSSGH